ncbi:MAG: hypothetical protein Q9217_003845 [Psora testacea]
MAVAKQSFQARLDARTTGHLESGKTFLVGVAIFRPSPSPNTASTIKHQHQLLIVKRAEHAAAFPDQWELPGGHVESGETVRQCVQRETMEETGLVVDRILGELQNSYDIQSLLPMEVRLNPREHSEWIWLDEDAVDTLPTTSPMKKVLRDSFQFSKTISLL